jgi:hypothetical protein
MELNMYSEAYLNSPKFTRFDGRVTAIIARKNNPILNTPKSLR